MIPCTHCGKPIIPGDHNSMQGEATVKGRRVNVYLHYPECIQEFFGLQKEASQ